MAAPSFPWRQNVPRNRPCSASEAKWVRTGETYKKKLSNWEHLPATALADAPLYTWAANIAHLDDENVKVDESLKDIDLDLSANSLASLLGGGAGKALLKSEPQDIDGFEKGSLSSRKKDLANNCLWDYEDFTWNGLQVRRIKLDWAIARRATWDSTKGEEDFAGYKNQYKKSEVARHVALQVSKDENRPPKATDAEILNIMAMMLEELGGIKNVKNRVSLRKDNARWRKLCQLAQGWWYRNYRNQSLDQVPGEEDFPPHSSCTEWRDEVLRNKSKFSTTLNDNKYAAWLEDQYIGENACLQCNQDIVIIRDAHDELVAGAVVEATQRLFPAGVNVAERMTEAIRRFTWRYPTSMPDPIRHPTNEDDHLILNPKLDVRNTGITMQEAHEAVCSTDHYGIRFPIGHSDPKDLTFANFGQNSTNNKKVPISTAWTEEFPKLRTGAWGIAVKELRLTLKAWDEGLYNDYIEIRKWLPQKYLWETGNGDMPYYFMAQLCGVQTEGHTDKSDVGHHRNNTGHVLVAIFKLYTNS